MYGSYRFYIDKWPTELKAITVLKLVDMFATKLGTTYNKLIHTLYSPDQDTPIVHREFANDILGRNNFISSDFIPLFIGKYGEVSAPFVIATFECKPNSIYEHICIKVQLPYDSLPMIVSVDFDFNYTLNNLDINSIQMFLTHLYDMGYRVNNSFYHVYFKKNTATILDRGQIGSIITLKEKQILKYSVEHGNKNYLNNILDVFVSNSILSNVISDKARIEITKIVGENFVGMVAENFVFSIPSLKKITPHYDCKHFYTINKLRRIIRENQKNQGDD